MTGHHHGSGPETPPRIAAAASLRAAPPVAPPLLAARGLSVAFESAAGRIEAVRGLDLSLGPAETLGIVGESGSGKSVACQALLGLLPRSARVGGRVSVAGTELEPQDAGGFARLRGGTLSMIFQDPMSALDPLMTVGGHLRQRLRRHGVGDRAEREGRALELLRRVGVADARRVLHSYPHQLSGGLCQRAAIALALAGAPRLLVADEPTTALDVTIQAQVLDLLAELRLEAGLAVVLISHDLGVVAELCDRIAVLYAGQIVEEGPVEAVLDGPAHPYSAALVAARPMLEGPRGGFRPIPGVAPAPGRVPDGCAFAPRCPRAAPACAAAPALRPLDAGRRVRCHFPEPGHG